MKVLKPTRCAIPLMQAPLILMLLASPLTYLPVPRLSLLLIVVTHIRFELLTLTPVFALLATRPTTPLFGLTMLWTPLGPTRTETTCGVHGESLPCGLPTIRSTPFTTRTWFLRVRPKVRVRTLWSRFPTPTLTRTVAMFPTALVIPKLTLFKVLLTFRTLAKTAKLLFPAIKFTVMLVIGVPTGMFVLTKVKASL